MLVLLALTALASFAGAVVLPWLVPLTPAAHVHLALGMGVMPLIMGAMTHFIPVLTRSAAPHPGIRLIPAVALAAGALAFSSFAFSNQIYYFAALLALAGAAAFAIWIRQRATAALGSPHPCLYWYLAALACLMLALAAIAAMAIWPEQRIAFKRLHLHLNTLGFVGLTAIATLQVLLPTAVGRPDPQAAERLKMDLKWALSGTLLISLGAAWWHPLAWVGAALWAWPLMRLGKSWYALYFSDIRSIHGAAPALAAALAGYAAALLFGLLHGSGWSGPIDSAHAFILAFLFPLVTGAVSQLLPVWLRPGPHAAWHSAIREGLVRNGGIRGTLFLCGGLLVGMGWHWGLALAVAGLAAFLWQLAKTILNRADSLE